MANEVELLRVDPREDDIIKAQVRDDIDALTGFTISLIGSYTSGE